jgi:hypothetical protein
VVRRKVKSVARLRINVPSEPVRLVQIEEGYVEAECPYCGHRFCLGNEGKTVDDFGQGLSAFAVLQQVHGRYHQCEERWRWQAGTETVQ